MTDDAAPRPLTSPELLAAELDELTPARPVDEKDLSGASGSFPEEASGPVRHRDSA